MPEVFIDSNVFLRFLVNDDRGQAQEAEDIFLKASSREIDLVTGPPVLFEVAWTLSAWAKWPNEKILDALKAIASIPNLKVIDENLVMESIVLAKKNGQAFADAYITVTAKMRGAKVATFNTRHFAKLGADMYVFNSHQ